MAEHTVRSEAMFVQLDGDVAAGLRAIADRLDADPNLVFHAVHNTGEVLHVVFELSRGARLMAEHLTHVPAFDCLALVGELVAAEPWSDDDECVYCRASRWEDEPHEAACPWLAGRALTSTEHTEPAKEAVAYLRSKGES